MKLEHFMQCKICGSNNVGITYDGLIRDGALDHYTSAPVKMYQCRDCDAIWHEQMKNLESYYESTEYRQSLEGTSDEQDFYLMHDGESMQKFLCTGTTIFRGMVVADVGCGCGAFLDYLKGVAKEVVAIEPSAAYRSVMDRKGFRTFPYSVDAIKQIRGGVHVATSFDVIEHVENPIDFLKDIYELLAQGGQAIIGTPTDAPVMRSLLGEVYEQQQLFSTQHLWVFGEKNLRLMAKKAGFQNIKIKFFQRYGIGNMMGWIRDKAPRHDITADHITKALDTVWRAQLEDRGLADYIVLYAGK